jgi:predicted amidophosphoribosyltransferase
VPATGEPVDVTAMEESEGVVPGANPTPPPLPAAEPAPEALRICSNCGTGNNPTRKFCMKCGTKLPDGDVVPPRICPNCSTPNAPTRRFCMKCGTALVEAAPPTSESTTEWWRKT